MTSPSNCRLCTSLANLPTVKMKVIFTFSTTWGIRRCWLGCQNLEVATRSSRFIGTQQMILQGEAVVLEVGAAPQQVVVPEVGAVPKEVPVDSRKNWRRTDERKSTTSISTSAATFCVPNPKKCSKIGRAHV